MGREQETQVRSWGFGHVFTWSDGPVTRGWTDSWTQGLTSYCDSNAHYPPHSHSGLTTHLVVAGEMTLWYPNEPDREKKTYGVGSRVDVDAGRVHEVWMGDQRMLLGSSFASGSGLVL
ncbi:hypothetical protein E5D57_007093 [Metarhizium anisopliae]|nr:hypothetical protein E5D57_007093 [Metarhizium anisopliae]